MWSRMVDSPIMASGDAQFAKYFVVSADARSVFQISRPLS